MTQLRNSFDFSGNGVELKTFSIISMMPNWYNTKPKTRLLAMLAAIGEADANLAEVDLPSAAISTVRNALFVGTSTGADLSVIGQNYGIPRPVSAADNDELFAALVQALAWGPKGSLKIYYDVVAAYLGPQAVAGWQIFDPGGNQMVIQVAVALEMRSPATATYFHLDATEAGPPGSPFPGDYFLPSADYPGVSQITKQGTLGGIIQGPSGSNASVFYTSPGYAQSIYLPSAPLNDMAGYYQQPADIFLTLSGCTDTRNDKLAGNPPLPTSLLTNHPHYIGDTPDSSHAIPSRSIVRTDANNGFISWKLGDIFTSPENLFIPEDVGSTIVITGAATAGNNQTAQIIGYINPTAVVLALGANSWVTDANNGSLTWQLWRGVDSNIIVFTGNEVLQNLADTLEIAKMANIVVTIGDATV